MKKSLVAVSVIVVLGAAWTGASWYTGKLIEQRMGELVNNANGQIKTLLPKAGVIFAYKDYQRGIFSSQVRYTLQADSTVAGEKALKDGDEVAFIETIDHGPFPLAQLKKFNLIPSMASVHTELANTPALKKLFEVTKGKSPFTADSRIAYSGDTSSAITFIPIEYQKDTTSMKFSGAQIDADVSRDLRKVNMSGTADNLVFATKNNWDQLEQFSLQGLTLKSDSNMGKFDLSIGDQQLAIKQISFSVDGKDTATLVGFNLNTQLGETEKDLNGKLTYTLDALKIQGNDFGSGKLAFAFNNLDGQSLKQFTSAYNQQVMLAVQAGENLDTEAYQQQMTEMLMANLPALMKGNPTINIAPLSWKNAKGESTFTLGLAFTDPALAKDNGAPVLARSVKKVDATLTIPMPMATELTTQAARLQGYSPEEAAKMAQQQVQGIAAMGQMFKLTTTKDDVISSSFHFADNQVDLNGQKMSLPEFFGLFGMFGGAPEPEDTGAVPEEAPVAPQAPEAPVAPEVPAQ
ncbi:putative GTP-binding protein YdgA [Yersinia rohdei]|uniref:YdgA family protein n=1 Tax=Yersinia rohdei TaxID=29485 RepID=UPI0005DE8E08|nr:YdgA family protein [Yersinia rohdei]CNI30339.1 putative GTP-binding protein YdgA [Yersinia rohdei]